MSRSNAEWLADLSNNKTQAKALVDLREHLLRAAFVHLSRHRAELTDRNWQELEHLAEDSTQEALLQILARVDTFQGKSKFTTWAYRFVINIVISELQLHYWREMSKEMLVGQQEVPQFAFFSDRKTPDPETVAARKQILDVIHQILDEDLTERQRFALVNVHLRGVPMIEVARHLNSTSNNVFKLIHEARKKLKRGLLLHSYSEVDVLSIFR